MDSNVKTCPIECSIKDILKDMDVPASRKEITVDNCLWLCRNLFIRNGNNISFGAAKHLIGHWLHVNGVDDFTFFGN